MSEKVRSCSLKGVFDHVSLCLSLVYIRNPSRVSGGSLFGFRKHLPFSLSNAIYRPRLTDAFQSNNGTPIRDHISVDGQYQ